MDERPTTLADEHRQLAEVAASYAAGFAVGWAVLRFGLPQGSAVPDVAAAVAVSTSLALLLVAKLRLLPVARVRQLSPAYLVYGAVWIALVELWRPLPSDSLVLGVSWACLWILVYPLVAPGPKVPAVWAPLLAATMGPMVLAAAVATGARALPGWGSLVLLFAPSYIAAGLSLAPTQWAIRVRDARRLGSYSLTERVGRGGMGEVWRAEHHLLARPAAIKLLGARDGPADPEVDARFRREAQATSGLRSPHTVRLFDFGITDKGQMFHVMELLEGLDMESLVRRFGAVPPERAAHLLRQAALSLGEAHAAGLVHRDVNPRNLFVCRAGLQVDFVKVLDFGLVGRAGADPEGRALGTPGYLAPETVTGGEADARSDLYGLGCVAFWLLTGRQVFERRLPHLLAMDHAQRPPPPPSRFAEDLPEALEALVLACLAKDPAERPQSAVEVIARLDAVPWSEPWSEARAAAWWHIHLPDLAPDA